MPYNKQLINRPCSGRTGEYWPSVVALRTELRSVRTATTSGEYSPVRPSPSPSVSKRFLICFSTQIGIILKKHLNSRSFKQVGARSFGKINNSFEYRDGTVILFFLWIKMDKEENICKSDSLRNLFVLKIS